MIFDICLFLFADLVLFKINFFKCVVVVGQAISGSSCFY